MKKILLVALSGLTTLSFAQNLVNNPEFKSDKKVTYWSQIDKAGGWSDANGGSVDLFTSSSCETNVGIPVNFMGEEGSNGNYAGFIAYYDDQRISLIKSVQNLEITDEKAYQQYAEYLQGELTKELTAGQTYSFKYQVSLAENSGRAINGLGAYFSSEKLAFENNKALDFTPQIKSNTTISQESGWVTVEGQFTAKGGEKFVTIGAFEGSFTVEKTVEDLKENDYKKAYYYVYGPNLVAGRKFADFDEILAGNHVIFLTLNFETGKSNITPDSYDELNACVRFLENHPEVNIQIDGHTDATGTDAINLPLSKDRAAAVKTYMTNKGIAGDRISTEGYGSSQPLFTETENDVRNRRIELYIPQ